MMNCALCATPVGNNSVSEGNHSFCCHGCHAVYQILQTKGALSQGADHPLFQQAVRSGLISNPQLLETLHEKQKALQPQERKRLHLEIGDLWCPSCAELIHLILMQEDGILACVVDYATDLGTIEYDPFKIGPEAILNKISSLGYAPRGLEDAQKVRVSRMLVLRFGLASFAALNAMMCSYPIYASLFSFDSGNYAPLFAKLSFFFALPAVLFSAAPIYRRFWHSLKVGVYGMESLVTLSIFSAFVLSSYQLYIGSSQIYLDSMTVIIAFVLLGKIIETRAKFSAKETLLHLSRSIPRRGKKLFADGSARYVSVKEIHVGDRLLVSLGETIPLDGVVVDGEGCVDESLMTGEAVPRFKKHGDRLIGGTLLKQGSFTYETTQPSKGGALQEIIQMIQGDLHQKKTEVRSVDLIIRWFVPGILAIASLTAFFGFLRGEPSSSIFLHFLSILLISCPCAIGIAAPLVESHLINKLAKMGAIVRNRACLKLLGCETLFCFDKTGTITEGSYCVLGGLEALSEEQKGVLRYLTERSRHAVAVAINQALEGVPPVSLLKVEEVAGKGLLGKREGLQVALGSPALLEAIGVGRPSRPATAQLLKFTGRDGLATPENSHVYFAWNGTVITAIQLGDKIRKESYHVAEKLLPARSFLLSGDAEGPVEAVAKACFIPEFAANCSPLEKREKIEHFRAQGEIVAMVGDGINDAPSLAAADIGISALHASDMSCQVSDILLTTDKLDVLPDLRKAARFGQQLIQQNLFWAFIYNVIGVGLAVAGVLSPLYASFAMVASSLIVISNARRAR